VKETYALGHGQLPEEASTLVPCLDFCAFCHLTRWYRGWLRRTAVGCFQSVIVVGGWYPKERKFEGGEFKQVSYEMGLETANADARPTKALTKAQTTVKWG
jgi:hypothetical protein